MCIQGAAFSSQVVPLSPGQLDWQARWCKEGFQLSPASLQGSPRLNKLLSRPCLFQESTSSFLLWDFGGKTRSLAAYPEILEKILTAPGSIRHARNVSEWGFPLESDYAVACICHLVLIYLSRGRHISCTWLLTGADDVGINIRMCGSLRPGSSSSF